MSMSPAAQHEALAKVCGYPRKETRWVVPVGHGVCETGMHGFVTKAAAEEWSRGRHDAGEPQTYVETISAPDYLNDLDAMREAEALLTVDQCYAMNQHLCDIVGAWNPTKGATNWLWHATAAQRAEALLRTLGLWVE